MISLPPVRLVAALSIAGALLIPASAQARPKMEMALQDDAVFVHGYGMDRENAVAAAAKLHATRIRVNVLWSRTLVSGANARRAPRAPVYDFSAIDALQASAARRHIKLQLTLTGPAPAWAAGNHRVGPVAPDPVKYGAFVRAVATHFKGRVDRYSIWNEPNWNTWLAPARRAPVLYRGLYRAGYAAVKRSDPRAKVLIGELAPIGGGRAIAPLRFMRALTCSRPNWKAARRCAPLKADGFALHPYQLTRNPRKRFGRSDDVPFSALGRLTTALDKLTHRHALATPSGGRLNLYLTEFGYLTKGSRAQSKRTQAAWLTTAYRIAKRNPRVREFLHYQLIEPAPATLWHSSLLTSRGAPRPAYTALARAAAGR